MGQWVLRSEHGERQGSGDGGFALLGIAKGTNEAMMRFDVAVVRCNRRAKELGRFGSASAAEQMHAALGKLVSTGRGSGNL